MNGKLFLPMMFISLLFFSCAKKNDIEQVKQKLGRYLDMWNTGNFENIENMLHTEFELRMSPEFESVKGIEKFKESVNYWRTAYPDFKVSVNETIYDKDIVAIRWTVTATNTGPGKYPPTGKSVNVIGMSIIHFSDGKILDEWISGNDLLWLTQLGYVTLPAAEEQ